MFKDMFKTGLFLFTVAAICGSLLAFSESKTGVIIANNKLLAEQAAQKEVLPCDKYVEKEVVKNNQKAKFSIGFDNNNQVLGAIIKVAPTGFNGPISTMVGLDKNGKIIGYKILSLSETPGLGMKLKDSKFNDSLAKLIKENPSPKFSVKKDGGDVDAITAATISSRGFCSGLRQAQTEFQTFKEEILTSEPTPETSATTGGNK